MTVMTREIIFLLEFEKQIVPVHRIQNGSSFTKTYRQKIFHGKAKAIATAHTKISNKG